MCSSTCTRTRAYAQAYHHQANGRAEVAGRELKKILGKMTEEETANWVEMLPVVRQHMHDVPGPTGLTPYEIVLARPEEPEILIFFLKSNSF